MAYLVSLYYNQDTKNTICNYKIIEEDVVPKSKKFPIIAATIMVKNEESNIIRTLLTCSDVADLVIILDTGSTDKTLDVTRTFCKSRNLPLFIIFSEWIDDFSHSRNILLTYSDDKADYLLLYDANDELKESAKLKELIRNNHTNKIIKGYYTEQEWSNLDIRDNFKNVKIIRTKQGWKYHYPIHEYILTEGVQKENVPVIDPSLNIKYYQDRIEDNNRTKKRQTKDLEVLNNWYLKNPTDPRTLFYYAQTLAACGHYKEAYIFYQKRIKHKGHPEEIFLSLVKCGELSYMLEHGWEESHMWYIKAFEYMPRIEPLIRIVHHYYDGKKNLHMALLYIRTALLLTYPAEATLFVSTYFYNYFKWHLYAKICYDIGLYKEAHWALGNILSYQKKCDLDLFEAISKNNKTFKNESIYKFENTKVFTF